jgi:hypothetical protein
VLRGSIRHRWCDGRGGRVPGPQALGGPRGSVVVSQLRAPREGRSHQSGRHTRVARAILTDLRTGSEDVPTASIWRRMSPRRMRPNVDAIGAEPVRDPSIEVWNEEKVERPGSGREEDQPRCAPERTFACCAAAWIRAVPRAKCGLVKEVEHGIDTARAGSSTPRTNGGGTARAPHHAFRSMELWSIVVGIVTSSFLR